MFVSFASGGPFGSHVAAWMALGPPTKHSALGHPATPCSSRNTCPPLGVEVVWEFQEFQEFKTTQSNFKRRKRVTKIKRRQMFDRRAFIMFRT